MDSEYETRAFGLYIHIPFCASRCSYCDFVTRDDSFHLVDDYVRALCREIEIAVDERTGGDSVCGSVYFGGGTPSLLSEGHLTRILETVMRAVTAVPGCEFTLEANPQDIDKEKLNIFRTAGINRLSIGCQSFHDEILTFLSRRHTAARARQAVNESRDAGFDNLSIDLMFNIPFQSKEMWETDVREALTILPEHISLYSLTIEPGTPMRTRFQKGEFTLPDDETSAALFVLTDEMLTAGGYRHYEVSNFAKPGFRSRHNSSYWSGAPYIGTGAGAHSFFGDVRSWNVRTIPEYIKLLNEGRLPERERETLTCEQKFMEKVMLSLRTEDGLNMDELEPSGKERLLKNMRPLENEKSEPVLRLSGNVLHVPAKYWVMSDEIIARLIV